MASTGAGGREEQGGRVEQGERTMFLTRPPSGDEAGHGGDGTETSDGSGLFGRPFPSIVDLYTVDINSRVTATGAVLCVEVWHPPFFRAANCYALASARFDQVGGYTTEVQPLVVCLRPPMITLRVH